MESDGSLGSRLNDDDEDSRDFIPIGEDLDQDDEYYGFGSGSLREMLGGTDDDDEGEDDEYDSYELEDFFTPEKAARIRKKEELAAQNLTIAQLKALGESDYDSYLLTPHWLKTSEEARARAGYRCQEKGCGRPQTKWLTLQAHHIPGSYKFLGEERPQDLVVLCPKHHKRRHGLTK